MHPSNKIEEREFPPKNDSMGAASSMQLASTITPMLLIAFLSFIADLDHVDDSVS
jgi:hypothetical protein